jgi:hypothetical protein
VDPGAVQVEDVDLKKFTDDMMKKGANGQVRDGALDGVTSLDDLIGSDEANLDLSRRRAAAVRNYLVESLRMDGSKIVTRGKGEAEPLVPGGTVEEQALNRRVEIRMRKDPPPAEPARVVPKAVPAPAPEATPPAPRAVPVKPARALPVQEPPATPPRATPVPETPEGPAVPKAEPVDPDDPVESPPPVAVPRAEAVEE